MTTNPQTQKIFFSKVSHFFRFPKTPTYNFKPYSQPHCTVALAKLCIAFKELSPETH